MDAETLRRLLHYEPTTGIFTWRISQGPRKAGLNAGCVTKTEPPRVFIGLSSKMHAAHRLAWLYVHGEFPKGDIDHMNGDTTDNRIANLRDVTHGVNLQNQRRPQKHGHSGKLGVCVKTDGRITASISLRGKQIHLGSFRDVETAHQAYLKAKREIHPGNLI